MAERDMTGEDRPERDTPESGLARRRAEDPPRIGRFGFGTAGGPGGLDELGELEGLAGGGGDLANLPPWSVRDAQAGAERPDRDPVALAAWRRVAERRRQRAAAMPEEPVDPADEPAGGHDTTPAEPPAAPMSQRLLAEQALAAIERGALDDEADDVPGSSPVHEPTGGPTAEPVGSGAVRDEPHGATGEPDAVPDPVSDAGPGAEPDAGPDAEPVEPPEPAAVEPPDDESPDDEGLEPWLGAGAADATVRDPHAGPPGRAAGPAGSRGGYDPRPGGGPSDGRHDVLLSLAGRIDDDALTSVRELVAVEDEAAAAELLGGCLLAAGAGVTAREHAVLGRWFAATRVDPELVDALPRDPEADRRDEHRFTANPPSGAAAAGGAGEAVARAATRLPGVQRVQQCWRTTPAGTAPGPVPHRVVLVETRSADDCEHVAHHVAHAAREHGAVSVEVFAAGAELPAYHRAAVRAARPLDTGPPSTATTAAHTPSAAPTTAPTTAPTIAPSTASPTAPTPASPTAASPGASLAPSVFAPSGPATPMRPRRPEPAPSWRRAGQEAPSFEPPDGDEVPPPGVAGPATTPVPPAAPEPAPPATELAERAESGERAEPTERAEPPATFEPAEPAEERYRTVASAGPDPLERGAAPEDRGEPVEPLAAERPSPVTPPAPEPPREPAPEPAPVDLDPDVTAERIAALWRVPPPDEILSDQHPISEWSEGPVGPTFGPGADEPTTTAREFPTATPGAAPVDPDAATGDIPVVAPRPDRSPQDAPAAANGQVRRARHSRHETGELELPAEVRTDGPADPAGVAPAPTKPTNGHRHGPEAEGRDRAGDAATGPVERQDPATAGPRPPASSGPDSFDVQLSERERELLSRLHEELASRERLAPESPDPLLGRPPAGPPPAPPGSEDTTAPRPRPGGPPPGSGRPGPWHGPPPGVAGTNGAGAQDNGQGNGHGHDNGHGPVNGHGLPRRADDDEDGPSRDA